MVIFDDAMGRSIVKLQQILYSSDGLQQCLSSEFVTLKKFDFVFLTVSIQSADCVWLSS